MELRRRASRKVAGATGRHGLRACAAWLLAAVAALLLSSHARAAELSARGPAACPDAAELTFRVERAIGMPLSHAAALRFTVRFERASDYVAQLEVDGGASPAGAAARRFSAADCSRLGDAVGFAIALALGATLPAEPEAMPDGKVLASEPSSALPELAAPPAALPPDEPPAPAPEQSAPALTPVVAAGLLADSGSLPAAGLGLSLSAELRLPRWALRVGGLLLFDQRTALRRAGQPAAGAELGLALGSAALCTRAFSGAALLALVCGGWELGRIEGSGSGVPQPRRGSALWTAPRLDAQLSWGPLAGPVRLWAQLGAAAPLKRDDFFLRDIGSVHRPPVVVGRAGLGLEVSFD